MKTTQPRMVAAIAAANGMSVRDIERALGVSNSALATALKRGPLPTDGATGATGKPASVTVEAVARVLGVPVAALLGEPVALTVET